MVFIKRKSKIPGLGIDRSSDELASVMLGVMDRATTVRQAEGSNDKPGEMAGAPAEWSREMHPFVWPHKPDGKGTRAPAILDHGEKAKKRQRLFGFLYEMTVMFFNIVVWGLLALFALLTLIHG